MTSNEAINVNILPGVRHGEDITCLETLHYDHWLHRDAPYTTCNHDKLFIVYKDKNHKKKVYKIDNPRINIYFVKPEYRTFKTPREHIEIDKCYPVKVQAKNVINAIVREIRASDDEVSKSTLAMYDTARIAGIPGAGKEVLKWPYTVMSDINVESYYRIMLGYQYNQMRGHTVDKCWLDIESDVYGLSSTQQQLNLDKTNACTLIFKFDENGLHKDERPQVFTLLLRNHKRYPQQADFEDRLPEFIKTCHDKFDYQTIIKNGKKKVIETKADYHIKLFDSEAELLKTIFQLINSYQPDTCEVWNIAYDIPKMYARMQQNKLNPVEVMCDPNWDPTCKWIDINIDNRPIDIAERKTSIRMASTTLYLDQMQNYAGIRKGRKAYGSNKLDNIANIELGMGKWSFPKGVNVLNAAIKDYWDFVLYSIRDVWCQALISQVTNDCMAVIYDMNQSFCPARLLFKQITYQKQIYYTQKLKRGFLSGNNPNINYAMGETEEYLEYVEDMKRARKQRRMLDGDEVSTDEEDDDLDDTDNDEEDIDTDEQRIAESLTSGIGDIYLDSPDRYLVLQGGMVGNPDLNTANGTELIVGVQSKHFFDDVQDLDFASEYPWAKVTRSLSKSTQFGRLIIPDRISSRQNSLPMGMTKRAVDLKYYTSGGEFVADYVSGDIISLGSVWFNLPSINEMNEELKERKKL